MFFSMTTPREIAITREFDIGRGSFLVDPHEPVISLENPRGVRHRNKTEQDKMPVGSRPRVIAANKRAAAMKASA